MNLDADWLYRRAAARVVRVTGGAVGAADAAFRSMVTGSVRRALGAAFRAHGPRGILARTWPAGSMVLWVSILLAAFLLLELF